MRIIKRKMHTIAQKAIMLRNSAPGGSRLPRKGNVMFTSMDKALTALVMAVLFLLNSAFGISFGLTEAQVATILTVLTPLLVYLIPNKSAVK